MPADEVTHGTEVDTSRARTGPRHAAPKKPLFTRFHMPAGKAIALAAMPTAVLMGMGFTPTLAQADSENAGKPTAKSLTVDEYKDCVAALADDASASPSPSTTEPAGEETAKPTPSASPGSAGGAASGGETPPSGSSGSSGSAGSSGSSGSSDSGSDDADGPTPTPSPSKSAGAQTGAPATQTPAPPEGGGNLLENIGDAISGIFTGGAKDEAGATATPSPGASDSAQAPSGSSGSSGSGGSAGKDASEAPDPVGETAGKATEKVGDTVGGATGKASEAAKDTTEAARDAAGEATATPSPSASSTADPRNCPKATDAEGGVDNPVPLPDDPWFLNASSLLLKGADYQGVVKVRTAGGATKKVLKYVISDGTDIGDLKQTVKDKQSGKTYHVEAAPGSTSTIRNGKTVMYTESISGNLLGLIPVTFDPENPPPLNIPLIYFTKVKVVQAGQFGGTLFVPGLRNFITD
ncbi:hypothetical protein SZN_15148 [Streptomyces zinciresistens K42]|uniref:Membrane-bound hydrophilic protein n=1 Tax=Streptomyces zinciresistens K42 TaxID=700597 RepID=G2GC05_9ACTN|nr:hypothetical protein [Streptomyces zinciresistens]EGX58929.1 hypothetical protein SZN_15148 [Streptomyces zinciresistens K42]